MPGAAVHRQGALRLSHARFPKASATKRLGQDLTCQGLAWARLVWLCARGPCFCARQNFTRRGVRRNRRHGKGAGQARVPIAIQVPSGIGGSGRGYPWQTGMTSGGVRKTNTQRTATQTLLTLAKHSRMTPGAHGDDDHASTSPRGLQRGQNLSPYGDHAEKQAD